ncbi:OsmC family protein [Flavobacterium terrisoli]|uniref:OsmC family protein n=1 Tax=Flavobacterium terrisoli TaxID=3242195 RepID=UPI002542D8D8|nr:OsmC family protein [Flavobacterium buctense]
MKISASIKSSFNQHDILVQTNNDAKGISIAPKASGFGSSVNGGELLLLSLATCFCNDIYREAAKRNLQLTDVEVVCHGEFGAEGETGSNFTYTVNIISEAPQREIEDLIQYTDNIAEVHNTLRKGINITLTS